MARSVLVLGDDFFPVQGTRTMLSMLGLGLIGPARDLDHAGQLLRDHAPQAAVLDIELGRDFVFALADLLDGHAISFGFVGPASLLSTIPERHLGRPVAHKPYGINHLEHLLRGLGCTPARKIRA